jgi:hypothetical protein
VLPNLVEVAAVLAVLAAVWLVSARKESWAFAATTFAMAATLRAEGHHAARHPAGGARPGT